MTVAAPKAIQSPRRLSRPWGRFRSRVALLAAALGVVAFARAGADDSTTTRTATGAADDSTTATRAATNPAPAAAPVPGSGAGSVVYVVPVHGVVEDGLAIVLARAMRQAEREDAAAIVLDMDTPGGKVSSAIKIRDMIVRSDRRTLTYVNSSAISAGAFIALATNTIVMGPASNIGDALPITIGPDGATAADEKFISYFSSEMRKTADHRGHPKEIAEAFCNPDTEIPGLKEKGKLLTLIRDEATSVGLAAYAADTLEELLEREGYGAARVVRFRETGTDKVARFLANPAVAGILLLVGLGGIFLEIKTPGFGVPGSVGIASILLFFFGAWLANLSGYMGIIVFFLGLALLLVEIFVIPGFGVPGILGISMMVGSAFFALFNLAPEGFDFSMYTLRPALTTMAIVLVSFFPLAWLLATILPNTGMFHRLVLEPVEPDAETERLEAAAREAEATVPAGARGEALSDLRPAGVARFDGRRVDVTTEGEYIERGRSVEVVRVVGRHVVVRVREE